MKIVIDIDENVFTRLFDNGIEDYEISPEDISAMATAIRSGTPLPKGHGRLIEADKAEEVMMYEMCGTGYQCTATRVLRDDFYTPTIIEADKE